ncbi:MAG: 2-hydroxyacid dehydrogenase [Calditrichia bacterium]
MNSHKKQILVTFDPQQEGRLLLQKLWGDAAEIVFLNDVPEEGRREAVSGADVLFSWNFPHELRAGEYSLLKKDNLLIQLISAGADHVPFAQLPPQITVASNVGAFAGQMAEHVLAMTLALAKRLLPEHMKLKQGDFDQRNPTRALKGKVCGILGFGGIGRASARLMRGLDMKIYAMNRSGETGEAVEFIGTMEDLHKILESADVLVISLPLNRHTRGLIDREALQRMKPDAILVNVARGHIIDEKALYEHLKTHRDFLAGIDAWWVEPFSEGEFRLDYPFLDLPNVIGSPHNSAIVPDAIAGAVRQAAENVSRYLKGASLKGIVKREDYISG